MNDDVGPVVGRFAPSPTGPLHLGSLVAAMASWLDARARDGRWLLRIEDLDRPREVPGAADAIVGALADFGFRWDGPVVRQSERTTLYQRAFARLDQAGLVYPCGCTRREIEDAAFAPRHDTPRYPGTCRNGLPPGRAARAWRVRVPDHDVTIEDRAAGTVTQNPWRAVGDFVVRRADGPWAYQLAVVVDDAEQGITDVVRGCDLLDSTPRQRLLQELLALPPPRTLHVPLVLDADGRKLAKHAGATPLDHLHPLPDLHRAAAHLGLEVASSAAIDVFWTRATAAWTARWLPGA